MADEKIIVGFDDRLSVPLKVVCKNLGVNKDDFVSLAISSLLEEELDRIDNKGFDEDPETIRNHKKIVNEVKFEANEWVINRNVRADFLREGK